MHYTRFALFERRILYRTNKNILVSKGESHVALRKFSVTSISREIREK